MKKIKLGDKVRDTISGFEGITVSRTEHINGCVQFDVVPRVNDKGEMQETVAFDVETLELIEEKEPPEAEPSGGGYRPKPKGRK